MKLSALFLLLLTLNAYAQVEESTEDEIIEYSFERSVTGALPVSDDNENYILEGDIAHRIDRSAGYAHAVLWPKGILIYSFENKSSEFVSVVKAAMKEIEAQTKLRFKQRTNESDYVLIGSSQQGCWSMIGKNGGVQKLNLQLNGCVHKGIVIHEFLHAFGVLHEQSRTDRDNYVTIHLENIEEQNRSQFSMYRHSGTGSYDLNSIMHYGSEFFSANGRPTITTKDGKIIKANRDYLTTKDIFGLNEFYKKQLEGDIERPSVNYSCDAEIPFMDSKLFEEKLRKELSSSDSNTCVKFPDQTYSSTSLPERLEKWLAAIKKSGGKVEYQEVARGWLSKLLEFILGIFGVEVDKYADAKKYHALIQIDKNTKQVLNVIFYPR